MSYEVIYMDIYICTDRICPQFMFDHVAIFICACDHVNLHGRVYLVFCDHVEIHRPFVVTM